MDPHAPPPTFCPQCGAPAPFRGTAVSLVCEFCESTIVRSGADIRLIGKVSAIVDSGSPILLGSRGRHHGKPFTIVGRLQVGYARGTWSEWFVEFVDGAVGWLTDAQGQYALLRAKHPSVTAGRVPTFDRVAVGTVLSIDGVHVTVVDKRGATYRGAEGSLPFEAEPGLPFFGVDLRGYGGEFVSLDYGHRADHNQPLAYMGEAIDLEQVGLSPLRSFHGWPRPTTGPGRAHTRAGTPA